MDSIMASTSTSETSLQRVPFELLSEIFAANLADYQQAVDDARHVKEVEMRHPSIILSHVCRAWRDAAITDPTLWRRIYIPRLSHQLVDLYLERSRGSTLAVRIDHMPGQPKRAVESAVKTLNSMARIGELCLTTEERFTGYYFHYLERPAPRLKRLALHIDSTYVKFDAVHPRLQHKILDNIEISPLHTLRLRRIVAPWSSSIFHKLTSLSIEHPTTPPTINELLEILGSAPHLTHMTFRDGCHTAMIHSPPYRRISLPRLVSLQLEMICHDFNCLCENILTPALASWSFKVDCHRSTRSPLHPCRSFPFTEQSHSLVITSSRSRLHIAAKSPSRFNESFNETILGSRQGYFRPPVPPIQGVAIIIKSHFPAQVLYVFFTMRWVQGDSPVYWAELLACFPKVRTLTLNLCNRDYNVPLVLMKNFATAFMNRSNDHLSHFHCSELSRLNIETDMSGAGWDQMAGLLSTSLSFRTQHHLPKIDLQVKDCSDFNIRPTFMAHHARILEPVVKSLTWEDYPDEALCMDQMGV